MIVVYQTGFASFHKYTQKCGWFIQNITAKKNKSENGSMLLQTFSQNRNQFSIGLYWMVPNNFP